MIRFDQILAVIAAQRQMQSMIGRRSCALKTDVLQSAINRSQVEAFQSPLHGDASLAIEAVSVNT